MSKVTVIVPIYNAEKKLTKCIRSIINQSFGDFELILINDGSVDNSLKVCHKYQIKDKRVRVIDKQNEGCIATRRRGVEAARSQYVMFVDADDWIHKEALKILFNESIESQADITVCNMYKVLGDKISLRKKNSSLYFTEDKIYNKEEIREELITAFIHGHPFPSSLCAKLYKRELLISSGKYLKSITFFGEDLYYNLEIFLKASKVKVIGQPLYFYRTGGNTSSYMSYLFSDIVNGYLIQKEVIEEYYKDTTQQRHNGISIMFLNTFKTCLYNLFNSKHTDSEIKDIISNYVSNKITKETASNEGSKKFFPLEYLEAINNQDVNYLYSLGERIYRKKKPKQILLNIATKLSIL